MPVLLTGSTQATIHWPSNSARFSKGAFGIIDRYGLPRLLKSDKMEVALLARLTKDTGEYVFKHRSGAHGYFDRNGEFVQVA